MADPIPHALTQGNEHINTAAAAGKPLPIDRFTKKSLILVVGGAGSYSVEVSNNKVDWVSIASGLVAGASPHLITTEHGASPRMPDKVAFLRVVTAVTNPGDHADFLGEDQH